jgi:hypothetical protein
MSSESPTRAESYPKQAIENSKNRFKDYDDVTRGKRSK